MDFTAFAQSHVSNLAHVGSAKAAAPSTAAKALPTTAQKAFEAFHSGGTCDRGVVAVALTDFRDMLMTMFAGCQLSERSGQQGGDNGDDSSEDSSDDDQWFATAPVATAVADAGEAGGLFG